MPLEVISELKLAALSAVRRRLVGLDPIPSAVVTDTLVEAEGAAEPHRIPGRREAL